MRQDVQTDATCNIQQCWQLWSAMLRPFARSLTTPNNTHQRTCNRVCKLTQRVRLHANGLNNTVCKRTQHVTSNNVGSCWSTMLRPFARGSTSDNVGSYWPTLRPFVRGFIALFRKFNYWARPWRLGRERGNKTISYLRFSLKQRMAGSHEDAGSSPDFKG